MDKFRNQLSEEHLKIDSSIINNTDWYNIKQIESLKRNYKIPKIIVSLSREMWISECLSVWNQSALIPVVVNKSNNHWIEWIKLINIKSQNIYIGVSCKYNPHDNKYKLIWSVTSICLDKGDIYNKHKLVGIHHTNKYKKYLIK